MMHYYLEKGHSIKELLNLSYTEKIFMIASMEVTGEEMEKRAPDAYLASSLSFWRSLCLA